MDALPLGRDTAWFKASCGQLALSNVNSNHSCFASLCLINSGCILKAGVYACLLPLVPVCLSCPDSAVATASPPAISQHARDHSMPCPSDQYSAAPPSALPADGLVGSNLGDVHWKVVTLRNGGGQQTVPEFLLDRFEYSYGFLGQVSAILLSWCIIYWALGAFAMKKVRS